LPVGDDGALVEPAHAEAVDAIVRAAMTGFMERFTHDRLVTLENKLRRKSSRLQLEREKTRSLKNSMSEVSPRQPKKKIASGPIPDA
jgi:hypothetical protein